MIVVSMLFTLDMNNGYFLSNCKKASLRISVQNEEYIFFGLTHNLTKLAERFIPMLPAPY